MPDMSEKSILASLDDLNWGQINLWHPAGHSIVGYSNVSAHSFGTALRYTDIEIPRYSTINSASIKVCARVDRLADTVNSVISAENVDSCGTWPTGSAEQARAAFLNDRFSNRTTATVSWNSIPAWTQNVWYTSPDISTVIQEIVNRPGWQSGNTIGLFWEDFSLGTSTSNRMGWSYDTDSAKTVRFNANYTPPPWIPRIFIM